MIFWGATVYDVVSAIMFNNSKNKDKEVRKTKKQIDDMQLRMEIKGRI